MAPEAIVALARLSLFKRMICTGQHRLLAVLFAFRGRQKSWLNALIADFSVLLCSPIIFISVWLGHLANGLY
eukprot:6617590-Karenia_brevis.AAC.1